MVDEIRTRAEIFQDMMMGEFHQIIDKLKTVDTDLKVTIAEHSKAEVENAILLALDKQMKPVRNEINLLINDVATARKMHSDDAIKHSKIAAAMRKELLGNDLDSKHEPQEDYSNTGVIWAMVLVILAFAGGVFLEHILKV